MSAASRQTAFYSLLVLNMGLQVFAFILVKLAAVGAQSYLGVFLNVYYLLALGLVGARAVVWQVVLRYNDLSKAYPFNSLVPVLILLAGVHLFDEQVTLHNVLGAMLLAAGVLLLIGEDA
jgi:drug/metabolite transporter (DMT)-like permease